MLQLLAEAKDDTSVYIQYQNELEKEYQFWMDGVETIQPNASYKRIAVMPDGTVLNRYFDTRPMPREESYAEDLHISRSSNQNKELVFTNLRAGAESGWDFSTRWFADNVTIQTIETTDIIPVDLNCLLLVLEQTISNAATIAGNAIKASNFIELAAKRKNAILEFCWNKDEKYFCDYHFIKMKPPIKNCCRIVSIICWHC